MMKRLAAVVFSSSLAIAACSGDDLSFPGAASGGSTGGFEGCTAPGELIGSCDWRDASNPRFHCSEYRGDGTVMCQENGQDLFSDTSCDRVGFIGCCVGPDQSHTRIQYFYYEADPDIARCKTDPFSEYYPVSL